MSTENTNNPTIENVEKEIPVILPPIDRIALKCMTVPEYERLQAENARLRAILEKPIYCEICGKALDAQDE